MIFEKPTLIPHVNSSVLVSKMDISEEIKKRPEPPFTSEASVNRYKPCIHHIHGTWIDSRVITTMQPNIVHDQFITKCDHVNMKN
jgi:hypothetical protein